MIVEGWNENGEARGVEVDPASKFFEWVFYKHVGGTWVSLRKATAEEMSRAMDACGATERLTNYIQAFSRLQEMTPQQLVNLALAHIPERMTHAYEQVIEELCSRVYPNWPNENPQQSDGGEKQ